MNIRLLEKDDYDKGYMNLINYFTTDPVFKKKDEFLKQFSKINSNIFVLEKNNEIISSGTILIEYKFHNNFKSIAHIQDVVVKKEYRCHGFGKRMIMFLIDKVKTMNCYKIVLNSNNNNKKFYENLGFISKGYEYNLYFN